MLEGTAVVGRQDELAEIAAFLDGSGQSPRVLVIQGEAGIGKTTLWRAAVDEARRRALPVLAAEPVEGETKLGLAALADLLDGVLDGVPDLPAPQRRALAVALHLEEPAGVGPDERVIAAAFVSVLGILTARGPLVLAVDDVQWLDHASAEVLAFALRRLGSRPVTAVLAQRIDREPVLPLGLARARAGTSVIRMHVGPLTPGALRRVVQERSGLALARPTLRRLHEVSGGNPFYALEIARALGRSGVVGVVDPLPVPTRLHHLLGARLSALPRSARELLPVVAALSDPTPARLRAARGRGSRVAEGLDAAVAAGVLTPDGEVLRFSHPLLASAAYASLGPQQRRSLHARIAAATADPEQRGLHLALAAEEPNRDVAADIEQAAARAARRGATNAAANLYAHARRLTPADELEASRRRSIAEAECAMLSGDSLHAKEVLERAVRGEPEGPGRARLLAELGRVYAWGLNWRASPPYLEQALREAGSDVRLRTSLEIELALVYDLMRDDVTAIVTHARAAVALAESLDDEVLLGTALALQAKGECLTGGGAPESLMRRALVLERAMADVPPTQRPSDYIAGVRAWTDDFEGALGTFAAICEELEARGEETALGWTSARMSEISCLTGAWADAWAQAARALELAVQADQTANQAFALACCANVQAHLGRAAPARENAARALVLADASGAATARRLAMSALGLLELSLDQPDAAHRVLAPLVAEARAGSIGEPGAMRFVPDAIEATIAVGQLSMAESLLEWYERRAQSVDRASALARSARCRGLLSSARRDAEMALAAFNDALAQHERITMPFERARTLLSLGAAQRRAKRRRAARQTLQQALVTFEALNATRWSARARLELARIGGRAPSGDGLTPTERRIAALVAEGKSNKEVASALYLSPKTVEGHLRNVFRKAGVRSRSELTRRLVTEDARAPDP